MLPASADPRAILIVLERSPWWAALALCDLISRRFPTKRQPAVECPVILRKVCANTSGDQGAAFAKPKGCHVALNDCGKTEFHTGDAPHASGFRNLNQRFGSTGAPKSDMNTRDKLNWQNELAAGTATVCFDPETPRFHDRRLWTPHALCLNARTVPCPAWKLETQT